MAVGVGVRLGVAVGVGVRLGVAVGVGVRLGVAVGVGVRLGVAVGVGVRLGVAVGVGVRLVLVPDIFDKDKKQVSLMYDPMRRIYEDMPALKYKVELNETARTHLKQIASRGEASARKVKRALVLLKADEGLPDRDIASGLLISASTVGRVRTRFVKEGLDSALNERPRPGQKRKLDGRQEAHLIAVACSDAPEGHADWTLQLLADKVVAMGFAESISLETVRQMLKKTSSSRGRRRSGVSRR